MSPDTVKKTSFFGSSVATSTLAANRQSTFTQFFFFFVAILGIATTTFSEAVVLPSAAQQTATPKMPLRVRRHHSQGNLSLGGDLGTPRVGHAYGKVLTVAGGSAPYQFSIAEGSLPAGLTLNPTTGSISGIPQTAGTSHFAVVVTDRPFNDSGRRAYALKVNGGSPGPGAVTISISPTSAALSSGAPQQFFATVSGTSNTAVQWHASAGTISGNGMFVAPSVSTTTSVNVTVTSMADPNQQAAASVTVSGNPGPGNPLSIATTSVPAATAGLSYAASLVANGGTPPYNWSVSGGALPSGIQLDPTTGTLSGNTSSQGQHSFTARVTDSASGSATANLSLSVIQQPTNSTGFDGPAELPRIYMQTAVASTPSPGSVTFVTAGSNLQAALNAAKCGDTLQLQAGATFTGNFVFPAKSCDDQHWITVRTSAPNSALPPEGTRLTPCFAGVSSLPARPALNCQSTQNVMAKLVRAGNAGDAPIVFAAGANHYRLIGLEITRQTGGLIVYHLVTAGSGPADHLILDRVWVHGSAQDETKSGFGTSNTTYVAVIDSTFTDMHCISGVGACTDGNAIGGGNGHLPMGPMKIVNNFLEAGGENILLGGGPGSVAPADIEVRRNHFFKPLTWMKGQPGFVGGPTGAPFMVKNLFELKNAERLLFEGNVLENNWGGFSQKGWGMVLTPRGSWAPVQDITIRYNTISHVGAGMQLCATRNWENNVWVDSLAAQRWSIHDVVIDDIDAAKFNGSGNLFQLGTGFTTKTFNNISISHITAFPDPNHGIISMGGATNIPKAVNIDFTNNLVSAGKYPVWSTGMANGCAVSGNPLASFNACWNNYSAGPNGLIGINTSSNSGNWPAGNLFPANVNAVQFANYNNGNGGDYTLLPGSPYKNAASDGKDLGADINAVNAATAGVR